MDGFLVMSLEFGFVLGGPERSAQTASNKTLRARRIVEDSTQVRRDECNAAMRVLLDAARIGGVRCTEIIKLCIIVDWYGKYQIFARFIYRMYK
jgi:hypothetical protein